MEEFKYFRNYSIGKWAQEQEREAENGKGLRDRGRGCLSASTDDFQESKGRQEAKTSLQGLTRCNVSLGATRVTLQNVVHPLILRMFSGFVRCTTNWGFNIVPQTRTAVIERWGKFHRIQQPGWFLSLPVIERIYLVKSQEVCLQMFPQSSVTQDNVRVEAEGSLFVRVEDPALVCYGAENPTDAITSLAHSVMRTELGKLPLDTAFHHREIINKGVFDALSKAAATWGLSVKRYELTNIKTDDEVARAMDSQSIAERKRRQTVLEAEAQKQSDITVSEGKKTALINEAEGDRQARIARADGEARALQLLVSAMDAGGTNKGELAFQFQLAKEYTEAMATGLTKTSTLFVPTNVTDVHQVLTQAMLIGRALIQTPASVPTSVHPVSKMPAGAEARTGTPS